MDLSIVRSQAIHPSGSASVASNGTAVGREPIPFVVLMLLICVILVPIEISISLGPLFLTASKLFLICATFIILPRLSKLEFKWYDGLITLHVFWTIVAYMLVYGPASAVQSSGFYLLEVLIVYLVARLYLLSLGQIYATIRVLFWMVAINAVFAIPEALTGRKYIHEFARKLTGFYYPYSNEVRMGLHRSTAFFEHSILLGVFCASILGLVWFSSNARQRMWKVPVILTGAICAASSAPLLVFMFQCLLIVLERVTRGVKARLSISVGVTAFLVITLENLSNRGFVGLLSAVVVNPQTTYMRKYQWQYAIDDVMSNPFFGFIPSNFTRPDWMTASIDNYWLLIMMRAGIPALLLLFGTILFIWLALARRQDSAGIANLRIGWGLMMIALLMTGSTVAFFGKLQPLLAFYIGLGAALANCTVPKTGEERPAANRSKRSTTPYTRFRPNEPTPMPVARGR